MNQRERNINFLKGYLNLKSDGVTKDYINKTISLYAEGKIKQVKTAQTIMNKLINTKKTRESAIKQIEKEMPKETIIGRLKNIKPTKKIVTWFVTGKVQTATQYKPSKK